MTEWGARKVYKITRVRTDMNPLKAFFQAEGEQVSVRDYFFQKYGEQLEVNQPLLEIGQKKIILLPPQLCTFESMPELMSKNKTLVNKYRKNPTEKLDAVKSVVKDISK